MDLANLLGELLVDLVTLARTSATPSVIATAGDLKHLAHLAYSEGLPMILDEPKLHFWSSAK
jgi:hypothetical protein